tara:strand:- start:476 stop:1984 length:1509 start_codon:yes stop_codon:yes gene_type:complete
MPRRGAAFNGKSIYLDGVSDYLDLQGTREHVISTGQQYSPRRFRQAASAHWRDTRSRPRDNTKYYRPAAWTFWVKFPASTISAVIANYDAGNTVRHAIVKECHANVENTARFGGYVIALSGSPNGTVHVVCGSGRANGGDNASGRCLRRGGTSIVADTWYNITAQWIGRANGNATQDVNIWVNGSAETLTPHYPSGITSGELAANTLVSGYSNPNQGTPTGVGNTGQGNYEVFVGKWGSTHTAMTVHEFAFWELGPYPGYPLTDSMATGIYNNGIPLASLEADSGTYERGTGKTSSGSISIGAVKADCNITMTNTVGLTKTYIGVTSGQGGTPATTGTINAAGDKVQFWLAPGNIDSVTELLHAITGSLGHGGQKNNGTPVYTINGSVGGTGILSLHQTVGGSLGDTDITVTGTGATAVSSFTSFTSGSNFLKGYWPLNGPAMSGSDQRLQYNSKSVNDSAEIITNSYWQFFYTFPANQAINAIKCNDAINFGGTWTSEKPG